MRRRTLLRVILAAAVLPSWVSPGRAAAAPPRHQVVAGAPIGGSGTAAVWKWVKLPNSGGLQVQVIDASGSLASVAVSWTADGVVTAAWPTPLTVTAPADTGVQAGMSSAGYVLSVRRYPEHWK